MLHAAYDLRLVDLSILVAILTSYTALDLAQHKFERNFSASFIWLLSGAIAMGIGIWAMHFIGMLAMQIPIPVQYNWPLVGCSILPAIAASGLALYLVTQPQLRWSDWLTGSVVMGSGIVTMHYIGMMAMQVPAVVQYHLGWVGGSIAIAVGVSWVALWLGFNSSQSGIWFKLGSALLMGLAIPLMHYTGMAAIQFVTTDQTKLAIAQAQAASSAPPELIAAIIALVTCIFLGWTLLNSMFRHHLNVERIRAQALQDDSLQLQSTLQCQAELAALAEARSQKLEAALSELRRIQIQLVHSEKMSSLGQLVAGVAHEINNPVNFIYGNLAYANEYVANLLKIVAAYQQDCPHPSAHTQALIEDVDLPFLQDDLDKILASMKEGAERIKTIVQSLRNFSRLDEAELKMVNIHDGIEATLLVLHNRLSITTDDRSLDIHIHKEYGDVLPLSCYPGHLNQALFNILTNAIDALEEKVRRQPEETFQPMITIRTQAGQWGSVQICISDNGLGIEPNAKRRIYDPFFTTKTINQRSGLGLSVAHNIIVEQHQGHLRCMSTVGQGTQFQIELTNQVTLSSAPLDLRSLMTTDLDDATEVQDDHIAA